MTLATASPKNPKPLRNRVHRQWVATHRCSVLGCWDDDVQAHHVKIGNLKAGGGIGVKPGDERCVPLCQLHHHELDSVTGEADFWATHGIRNAHDPESLWKHYARRSRVKKIREAVDG